jgi:hypothetical protein
MKIVNENNKTYTHPSTIFCVGRSLFRNGLRAYPYSSLLERDWQAFQSKKDMMRLFREITRISNRLPKLRNSAKVLYCKNEIEKFIANIKKALRKNNAA